MEKSDFRVSRADGRHRADVLSLLAEHVPGSDVAARYAWLYEQNPHGRAVTAIAHDERSGEPLGITSVFPRRVLCKGQTRLGSIGGDGFVRPSARRRGIATALHRACLAAMREEGIDAMFGPPERYNLRALERAGAHIVTHVCRYVRPRLVQSVLGPLSRLGRSARGARLDPITGHDNLVDEIFSRVADDEHVMPMRDAAFYAWRFVACPSGAQRAYVVRLDNRPAGICVLEPRAGRVAVVDLVAPRHEYNRVLAAVASVSEARSLIVQLNEKGPGSATLPLAGFFPRERKPFQVLATENADRAMLEAPRWYYTWGDGDVDRLL